MTQDKLGISLPIPPPFPEKEISLPFRPQNANTAKSSQKQFLVAYSCQEAEHGQGKECHDMV